MTPPQGASADQQPEHASDSIARLGRTYQLEGALRCRAVDAAAADAILAAQTLLVEGHGVLRVRQVRRHGETLVIAFQGFRTPERAQALVNALVYPDPSDHATRTALREAQPLRAGVRVSRDGAPFGVIEAVLRGPQTLLEIRAVDGRRRLVPANAPYVVVQADGVDLRDAPPGLLDDPPDG